MLEVECLKFELGTLWKEREGVTPYTKQMPVTQNIKVLMS